MQANKAIRLNKPERIRPNREKRYVIIHNQKAHLGTYLVWSDILKNGFRMQISLKNKLRRSFKVYLVILLIGKEKNLAILQKLHFWYW